MFRHMSLLLAVLVVAACANLKAPETNRTGTSDLEVLPPPPREPPPEGYTPRLRPPETPPETRRQSLPGYPESAVAFEVKCTARLLYHIQTDGSATLVRLEWEVPPPPEHLTRFEEKIQEAVASWEFIPAKKWVPTKMHDGSTTTVPHPIPKAERAVVRFRVEDGAGVVE